MNNIITNIKIFNNIDDQSQIKNYDILNYELNNNITLSQDELIIIKKYNRFIQSKNKLLKQNEILDKLNLIIQLLNKNNILDNDDNISISSSILSSNKISLKNIRR